MSYRITFQPSGIRAEAGVGETLLTAALGSGEGIESVCGGRGLCGKCKVRPAEGGLTPVTAQELAGIKPLELADGYRLACEASPISDCTVFVPEESRLHKQVVLGADSGRTFQVDPAVRNCYVELAPPAGTDNTPDAERVLAALLEAHGLDGLSVPHAALASLHGALKDGGYKLTATVRRDGNIIRFSPGLRSEVYGACFDVGTTTIAGSLCDLATGRTLAVSSGTNPQVAMGDDVMSRISYAAERPAGLAQMQSSIIGKLNSMLAEMAAEAGIGGTDEFDEVVLAGNTVMQHIIAGVSPDALGVSPFVPAFTSAVEFRASEAGLAVNPAAYVYVMPAAGAFVGGDISAVMAALSPFPEDDTALVVDLGTNGELVLVTGGRALTASCATGPAFEGAQISQGMRASDGAVERVLVDPDTWDVSCRIVGRDGWSSPGTRTNARGICGSGTVDLVARLRLAGVLDETGAFTEGGGHPRLVESADGGREFLVCLPEETASGRPVSFTQSDVRAVQLAKAAVRAGIEILMAEAGVERLDRVVLAGAFGNYMDAWSAISIGMLAGCGTDGIVQAGNAAGDGARAALLSVAKRREAEGFAVGSGYIELSNHPEFQGRFMAAMSLP